MNVHHTFHCLSGGYLLIGLAQAQPKRIHMQLLFYKLKAGAEARALLQGTMDLHWQTYTEWQQEKGEPPAFPVYTGKLLAWLAGPQNRCSSPGITAGDQTAPNDSRPSHRVRFLTLWKVGLKIRIHEAMPPHVLLIATRSLWQLWQVRFESSVPACLTMSAVISGAGWYAEDCLGREMSCKFCTKHFQGSCA